MADLAVRVATRSDTARIVNLLVAGLGRGDAPRTAEFWGWKHERNPFGRSLCLLAESDDGLAGMRAFMRWTWRSGGRSVRAVRAVDTVTHPDFRRQGVFSRLTRELLEEAAREGVGFVYNTPNRYSRPGYLKLGWEVIGRIPVRVRALRPFRMLRALAGRGQVAPPDLSAFPSVAALLEATPSDRLTAATAGAAGGGLLQTARSLDYVKWRYQAIPGFQYHCLWAGDSDPEAAIIFRGRVRNGFAEVTIAEILLGVRPTSVLQATALLHSLCGSVDADYVAATAASQTPVATALRQAGFRSVPFAGPKATVKPLNEIEGALDPLRIANWNLSLGDVEIF